MGILVSFGLSSNTSSMQGLYTYGIAAQAAYIRAYIIGMAWYGMGGKGIGARGTVFDYGGNHPFLVCQLQMR